MSRDEDDKGDRPRRSWREIDAMRGRSRHTSSSSERPAAGPRSRAATQQYLKQLDGLFSKAKGGAEGERLEKAVRDAVATPALADACRAYRDVLGLPEDPGLLTFFLDARDPEIVQTTLDALHAAHEAGTLRATSGLRTQLRLLLQEPDLVVAESAEALLEKLSR